MISANPRIGFIGFGEAAYHLSCGLRGAGVRRVYAYARALSEPERAAKVRDRADMAGVELAPTVGDLVTCSELVISAVQGNVALQIAREAAPFVQPGVMFADLNNAVPSAKKQSAELLNARGASFVDISVFGVLAEVQHQALMYVSGDGSEEFRTVMSPYGMNIERLPGEAGQAAAIKTLVNIYLKGLQALYFELALSAHKSGIAVNLLESLIAKHAATVPGEMEMTFWLMRGGLHADRKAKELCDVVAMMKEAGIEPIMTEAAVKRLARTGQYGLEDHFEGGLPLSEYRNMIAVMEQIGDEIGLELK